jgi:hypothetical protein
MHPPTMYLLILSLHRIFLPLSWAHVEDQIPLKAGELKNATIIHRNSISFPWKVASSTYTTSWVLVTILKMKMST